MFATELNGKTVYEIGSFGRQYGMPCSCLMGDAEEILEQHPEIRELAETMALEAVLADDVRVQWVVYPRQEWRPVETDSVRMFWH